MRRGCLRLPGKLAERTCGTARTRNRAGRLYDCALCRAGHWTVPAQRWRRAAIAAFHDRLDTDLARCHSRRTDADRCAHAERRSEEHTSELQSLMRTSYAVFCLKKKTNTRQ